LGTWDKQNEPPKGFEGSVNDLALISEIQRPMKKAQTKEKASSCDEASVVFALI
jgi:hypothetical protein